MALDQFSGVPLYVKVREKLRVELSQMTPGDAIPVEAELEKLHSVSRITVRRAIEDLVAEGLLVRQQGRGTFVQKPKLTHDLNLISSWTEQLKRMGFTPTTTGLKIIQQAPTADTASALRLAEGEQVIRVERLRLASREPISYMVNFYPARLVPDLRRKAARAESFYRVLEQEYKLVPAVAVDTVGTRPASEEEAGRLRIAPRAPVLIVRRLTYMAGGAPLELATVVSRGDRYQYRVTVHGRPPVDSPQLLERVWEENHLRPSPLRS